MVKSKCWADYEISTNITDANSGEQLLSIIIPDNKLWIRKKFECHAGQSLNYTASFDPVFWASDQGKIFNGAQQTKLPDHINADETAWNITICYPTQFENIPMPPEAKSSCTCDLSQVPPVPPQPLK